LMADWKPVKKDKDEYGILWALKTGYPKVEKEDFDNWVFCSYKKVGNREPLVVARNDKKSDLETIMDDLGCTDFNEASEKMNKYNLSFEDVRLGFKENKRAFLLSQ
jgi:hypothetical protein